MRRRPLLLTLSAALLATLAKPVQAAAPLRVVASFSILGDLVAQVARQRANVATLVGPDQDVHVYEPRPRDLSMVANADLLVRNGLELEGWMDRLTQAAGFRGHIVTAAAKVTPRTMREDGGALATDPHAWQDPRNAILYVEAIRDGLAAAAPPDASAFQAAADRFSQAVRETDSWAEAMFSAIPRERRRIITTHDAFGYYGARYGIEFLAAEGISTDAEPSAKAVAALIAQVKREKVRAVFLESMTSGRLARMLAQETGARLGGTVYSDALSPPGGPAPTYLAMLKHNTTLFAAAMS